LCATATNRKSRLFHLSLCTQLSGHQINENHEHTKKTLDSAHDDIRRYGF
jgi:hypothetical protein